MQIEAIRIREELYQKYTQIAKDSKLGAGIISIEDFLAAAQALRPTKEEREQVVVHDMKKLAEPATIEEKIVHVEPDGDYIIDDPLWNVPEEEWPDHMQARAARVRVIKAAAQWDVETQLEIAQAKYGRDLFDGGALLWRLPQAEQEKEIERLTKRSEDEPLRRTYNRLKAQNKNLYYSYVNMKNTASDLAEGRDSGLLTDFTGTSIAPEWAGVLSGFITFAEWALPKLAELGYEPTTDGSKPSIWRYRLFRYNKNLGFLPANLHWGLGLRSFR